MFSLDVQQSIVQKVCNNSIGTEKGYAINQPEALMKFHLPPTFLCFVLLGNAVPTLPQSPPIPELSKGLSQVYHGKGEDHISQTVIA